MYYLCILSLSMHIYIYIYKWTSCKKSLENQDSRKCLSHHRKGTPGIGNYVSNVGS